MYVTMFSILHRKQRNHRCRGRSRLTSRSAFQRAVSWRFFTAQRLCTARYKQWSGIRLAVTSQRSVKTAEWIKLVFGTQATPSAYTTLHCKLRNLDISKIGVNFPLEFFQALKLADFWMNKLVRHIETGKVCCYVRCVVQLLTRPTVLPDTGWLHFLT